MTHRIVAAPLALLVLAGTALAQDDPRTVGVSVEGALVGVPVNVAAQACGMDAETLLAEWDSLGTELSTMAETSAPADATDLAPEVAADTPMDAAIDGQTVADGADATHGAESGAAPDLASDLGRTVSGVQTTGAATEPGQEPGLLSDGTMDAGVEPMSGSGDDPSTADAATSTEIAAAGPGATAASPATPTEGTTLSKSAVCEVSRETADSLGIAAPG